LGLIVKLESMSVSRRISPTSQRLKRYRKRFDASERYSTRLNVSGCMAPAVGAVALPDAP